MFKPDFARLRQFCELGIPAPWLASLLFTELRQLVPCEAMTLLWRDPGASGVRLLHESVTALECDFLDVQLPLHGGAGERCKMLDASDPVLHRLARSCAGVRALGEQDGETLILTLVDAQACIGELLLHRAPGQLFLAAEKAALLQLSPVLSAALGINTEPLQLITSKAHTGILLLNPDAGIHSACTQARKLLQLARGVAGRARQSAAGGELLQQLSSSIATADPAITSSFLLRNCWGSFEFFLYPFGRREANYAPLTAVAIHRQEPLVLSVHRGCTELGLTTKQTDIALLLIQGCSNDVVAQRLRIGSTTVADHVRKIYRKVGAGNRSELVTALALGARKPADPWPLSCGARSLPGQPLSSLHAVPRK